IASFLKDKVALLREISPERLRALVEGSRVAYFEAREIILHQGAEATHFGVTLSGTIQVSVRRANTHKLKSRLPSSSGLAYTLPSAKAAISQIRPAAHSRARPGA